MSDLQTPTTDDPAAGTESILREELTRALGAVWQRYTGARPADAKTEVDKDVVRHEIGDGAASFGAGRSAYADGEGDQAPLPDPSRYGGDAIAAVTRVTGRKVLAYIPKRNKKTDIATDTFILAPRHRRR